MTVRAGYSDPLVGTTIIENPRTSVRPEPRRRARVGHLWFRRGGCWPTRTGGSTGLTMNGDGAPHERRRGSPRMGRGPRVSSPRANRDVMRFLGPFVLSPVEGRALAICGSGGGGLGLLGAVVRRGSPRTDLSETSLDLSATRLDQHPKESLAQEHVGLDQFLLSVVGSQAEGG